MRVTALLLGDAAAILLFSLVGRTSHGIGLDGGETLRTALPFLLAWWAAAAALGAYRLPQPAGPAAAAGRAALTWTAATPLGFALRALLFQRPSPLSFALVTFLINLALLAGWRALAAWAAGRRGSRS